MSWYHNDKHFYGDILLVSLASLMHWRRGNPIWLIYTVALTIFGLTIYDGLSILVPIVLWVPGRVQMAVLKLMVDVGCILYAGALLYALRSQEQIKRDIATLRSSRYINRPA